ncbi:MAG: hypothetical protein K2P81_03615 [Bacteriovoracaceae bacterium]|nr:hypothetical protein [Bacteriovoracaceae bacterium]
MFFLFFIFSTLGFTQTAHLETVCQNALVETQPSHFLNNPPVFSENFIARRLQSRYIIETISGDFYFEHTERINDLLEIDHDLLVLFNNYFIVLDARGRQVAKYDLPVIPASTSISRSMALGGEKIFFTRGSAGVSAFDIKQKKFVGHYNLDINEKGGSAEAIVFDGENFQIVTATSQQDGFTGVVTMSDSGAILGSAAYNVRKAGVVGVGARARWVGDKLLINNLGWLHVISKAQILKGKEFVPRWVAYQIQETGRYHYMMLTGDLLVQADQKSLMACGLTFEGEDPHRERISKVFEMKF